MITGPEAARTCALLLGLVVQGCTHAACLLLAAHPDGAVLTRIAVASNAPEFAITYMHSVTRTPVEERYRIDGSTIVETQMTFIQHGPGLPTAADAGGSMSVVDGRNVVTMARRFDTVVMRVHADQSPQLHIAANATNLTAWGNRALALHAIAGPCSDH